MNLTNAFCALCLSTLSLAAPVDCSGASSSPTKEIATPATLTVPVEENKEGSKLPATESAPPTPDEIPPPEAETSGELPSLPASPDGTLLRASNVKSIYFAYGSTQLSDSAIQWIGRHAERLRSNPNLTVTLYGYTDDFASNSYSIALGTLRAQIVRDRLLALKVSPSQIRVTGYGREEQPSVPCRTEMCRTSYRRVEFRYSDGRDKQLKK